MATNNVPNPLIDHSLLPLATSPTLTLSHPTPAENLRQTRNNGAAWRGSLELEQYMRREDFLADQDHSRNGGLTAWILIDTSLPLITNEQGETERVVLSGCETYYKRALVRPASSDVKQDGGVREVLCHGVGSVFCPEEFRRRGYTGRMMQLLGEALRTHKKEGSDVEVAMSTLYSDIGKTFYAQAGWEPFESTQVSLPALNNVGEEANGVNGKDQQRALHPKKLYHENLETLCEEDELLIRSSLENAAPSSKTRVALIPDVETITWLHAREDFVCKEILQRNPEVKGARVNTEKGHRAWCYWVRMYYNDDLSKVESNVLYILRLVVEPEIDGTDDGVRAVAALLREAQKEAAKWNMEMVNVWNPKEQTIKATAMAMGKKVEDVEVIDRETESITSLQWYGEMGKGEKPKEVVQWLANEKFGWC